MVSISLVHVHQDLIEQSIYNAVSVQTSEATLILKEIGRPHIPGNMRR